MCCPSTYSSISHHWVSVVVCCDRGQKQEGRRLKQGPHGAGRDTAFVDFICLLYTILLCNLCRPFFEAHVCRRTSLMYYWYHCHYYSVYWLVTWLRYMWAGAPSCIPRRPTTDPLRIHVLLAWNAAATMPVTENTPQPFLGGRNCLPLSDQPDALQGRSGQTLRRACTASKTYAKIAQKYFNYYWRAPSLSSSIVEVFNFFHHERGRQPLASRAGRL